jgi:hypothetical protein
MVESQSNFIFRKLTSDKYLTLEVMTYVEYPEVYKFMFSVTKETRNFFFDNIITIRNGFVNEGLIPYKLENDFNHYWELEKQYF